jgi:hypothetical protein
MAKVKTQTQKQRTKTWVEKLEAREPLNNMDEIKADADFNHKFRVREAEERARFEQRKSGGYLDEASDEDLENETDEGEGSN